MQPLGAYNWCCENIVFVTTTRNMFVGLFVKWVRFLTLLREYISFMFSELKFVKWVRFFERNGIIKWVIFFASFCYLWDFLPKNLKLIGKMQIFGFESFIFWFKFHCFGTVLGRFSQCNLKNFHRRPTMVACVFTQSPSPFSYPDHKKAS